MTIILNIKILTETTNAARGRGVFNDLAVPVNSLSDVAPAPVFNYCLSLP